MWLTGVDKLMMNVGSVIVVGLVLYVVLKLLIGLVKFGKKSVLFISIMMLTYGVLRLVRYIVNKVREGRKV